MRSSLKQYRLKRNFSRTAEPAARLRKSRQCRFVVQKHAASHLHYDFRLEMGGALKSWAVPKGIPLKKGEKRLAVQVEDHPVDYIDFEGTIPKGQYGGGTVMVWDTGTYNIPSGSAESGLQDGRLTFELHGKKLNGEWHLIQMRSGKQWLLIRGGEDMEPIPEKTEDASALSGKSMEELGGTDSSSDRKAPVKVRTSRKPEQPKPARNVRAGGYVEPMKARLVETLPPGEWLYEIKFDGFRAIGMKRGDTVSLLSRTRKDLGGKFPEIVAAVKELEAREAVVDGEIVALDEKGRSAFQLLQDYELAEKRPPIFYYVFDLLRLNGKDLSRMPLFERKERLESMLKNAPERIRISASLPGTVNELLKKVTKLGLEGLIAKKRDSQYEPGRRSGAWVKLKVRHEQEFVIGGYTDPEGARQYFGALLVGYYEGNRLQFAGKVGTGFGTKVLASLYKQFRNIASDTCPFANLPEKRNGRTQAITAPAMACCHWVRPELVGQIAFSEWTRDGKLRQPAFLGLRDDKPPEEVVKEEAA